MAEGGATVANAFVQIMPSMDGATGSITQAIMPELSAAGKTGGASFGANLLGGVKGKLVGAGAAIVGALSVKTIASGLMNIGQEFDTMTDTIVVGTGASGDALEELRKSAISIATEVPASFEGAGDVVQDLNTRMGMTGKDLEDTGKRVIATGKLIGESVDVSKLTGSLNAFNIANDEAAGKMDYLFSVSQATGIGFNDLTGILEANAPALQNLGFSFEQSANMAGLLDKAGMDASGTMSKMSKALLNLAEPGQTAEDAFNDVINEMQGYIEAGDTAAALDVASKVFGTKGAAQFVGALQSGAFSLDDIRDSALGAGEGILGTMDATASWPEKWEVLQNKAKAALEPLSGALMTGATEAMDVLGDALGNIDPSTMQELGETLGQGLADGVQVVMDFGKFCVDNFPTIATVVGAAAGSFGAFKAAMAISEVVGGFSAALGVATGAEDALAVSQGALNTVMKANPIIMIVSILGGLVAALITAYNTNEDFRNIVNAAWEAVWGVIEPIVTAIGEGLNTLGEWFGGLGESIGQWAEDVGNWWAGVGESATEFGENLQNTFGEAWDTVTTATSEAWEAASGFLGEKWEGLKSTAAEAFGNIRDTVSNELQTAQAVGSEAGSALTSLLQGDWESAKNHAANAYETIKNDITGKLDSAKGVAVSVADQIGSALGFPGLGATVSGVFDAAKRAIEDPIGTARDFIHNAIETIKGFFSFQIQWPHIPLPHFGINPPGWQIGDLLKGSIPSLSIQWYAQGGIVDNAQLFVAGEAGREAVVPLTQPALAPFAQAVAAQIKGVGRGETKIEQTYNIYANDPQKVAAVVAANQRRSLCY